jgi:hypothetical protein
MKMAADMIMLIELAQSGWNDMVFATLRDVSGTAGNIMINSPELDNKLRVTREYD